MPDIIEKIGEGSTIQHGILNNRIYLMKLDKRDKGNILPLLSDLAHKNRYTKIFCKVPKSLAPLFTADGYMLEATIPRFYSGNEDVFFLSKFLCSDRILTLEKDSLTTFSDLLTQFNSEAPAPVRTQQEYSVRKLNEADLEAITELYKTVFESYPFPIHDPAYILQTMEENVQYFGAEKEGQLAAISSSEIDFNSQNAEMTDFATSPDHRGQGLARILLQYMEQEMKAQHIQTLYTIARLNSVSMNKTFLRANYHFSGTLIKNTNISGKIESMNVYYKPI